MGFEVLLFNSIWVVVLGAGLTVWTMFCRKPGLIHFFWLALLVKLMMPQLVTLPVVPAMQHWAVSTTAPQEATPVSLRSAAGVDAHEVAESTGRVDGCGEGRHLPLWTWAWMVTGFSILAICLAQGWRFSRRVAQGRPVEAWVTWAIDRLAGEMGLAAPRAIRVDFRGSPAIWCWFGRATLILPSGLCRRLKRAELEGIILHEMAHLRRRDHWVRPLEVLAICVLWWNPVFWWVRSRIRSLEEVCCDAWVNRMRPAGARAYAEGLIKTVAYAAGHPSVPLTWAAGLGRMSSLKRRLVAIMRKTNDPVDLKSWMGVIALAVATCILAVVPTWAQNEATSETGEAKQEQWALEQEHERLVQEAQALQKELQHNAMRRQEIEMAVQAEQERAAIAELESEARQAAAEQRLEEAEALADQAEARKEALGLQQKRLEMELKRQEEALRMREEQLRMERALSLAGEEEHEHVKQQQMALQLEHTQRQAEMKQQQMEMELAQEERQLELEARRLEASECRTAQEQRVREERLECLKVERIQKKGQMERTRELAFLEQQRLEVEREMLRQGQLEDEERMEALRRDLERLKDQTRDRQNAMVQAKMEAQIGALKAERERLQTMRDAGNEQDAASDLERRIAELSQMIELMEQAKSDI